LTTRSGQLRKYWSGITNVHTRATANNAGGKAVRKQLLEQTGNKKFKETNFKKHIEGRKGGKAITKSDIRSAIKTIRVKKEKMLKAEYKELKKDGAPVGSMKDFLKANMKEDQDFQDIQELFNSP
jgi:hypothetical protein